MNGCIQHNIMVEHELKGKGIKNNEIGREQMKWKRKTGREGRIINSGGWEFMNSTQCNFIKLGSSTTSNILKINK